MSICDGECPFCELAAHYGLSGSIGGGGATPKFKIREVSGCNDHFYVMFDDCDSYSSDRIQLSECTDVTLHPCDFVLYIGDILCADGKMLMLKKFVKDASNGNCVGVEIIGEYI